MSDKVIGKYLEYYAEPEIQFLAPLLSSFHEHFDRCIAIPCFDEEIDFYQRLITLANTNNKKILLMLCVNRPDNKEKNVRNLKLIKHIQQSHHLISKHENLSLQKFDKLYTLLVDRSIEGPAIPEKQGVGLARKICCDIACYLYAHQYLRDSWIHSTDADAHWPANYLESNFEANSSAAVFSFSHIDDDSAVAKATQLYECALNYYVEGLKWAESKYAFHTIGSVLAINIIHYCHARGFPSRNAAEDFYLLNKLAKTGNIQQIPNICIQLESRLSERVPFGTGPAVSKIIQLKLPNQDYCYYAPECFIHLKEWLEASDSLFDLLKQYDNELEAFEKLAINKESKQALIEIDFISCIKHLIKQAKSKADCNKQLTQWFDAFRTLKFIRQLQNNFYPEQALLKSLQEAEFAKAVWERFEQL